jgi:hypothetical protein
MTNENKTRMMRLLLPLLAILVGTLLTAFAFLLTGFATAACNCSRPIAVAFPYASILWGRGRLESLGGALMAFQFPAYSLVVAMARSRAKRLRSALVLLAIHAVAVVISLIVYRN